MLTHMLRVKTILKKSAVSGTGLFAAENISTGTLVWMFTPGFDFKKSEQEVEMLNELDRSFFNTYCYRSKVSGLCVCPIDNARFMNHSASPNVGVRFGLDSDEDINYAVEDIPTGTELVIDYKLFDEDFVVYQSAYSQ